MNHGKQIAIAVDQLMNTLTGGWADETLSSRCWRWHRDGKRSWPVKVIDAVFFWEKTHCLESFKAEQLRLQSPPELRKTETTH